MPTGTKPRVEKEDKHVQVLYGMLSTLPSTRVLLHTHAYMHTRTHHTLLLQSLTSE